MERSDNPRIAWFREQPLAASAGSDETAAEIHALGQTHKIEIVTAGDAHDFVWRHFRAPFDLTVFEVGVGFGTSFMRPYLFHYPGIAVIPGAVPRAAGGATLLHRVSAHARLLVTRDEAQAARLADEFPTPVRFVPLAYEPGEGRDEAWTTPGARRDRVVMAATERARALGADIPDGGIPGVEIALSWPMNGESLRPALAAMAAGRAVIVYEMEATAGWPALDPQTWRPRGGNPETPIVISIDPRDTEHSLLLALRRLAADSRLRDSLAAAGQAWWKARHQVQQAVDGWHAAIAAAVAAPIPSRPTWLADGGDRARQVLADAGVEVDFLSAT